MEDLQLLLQALWDSFACIYLFLSADEKCYADDEDENIVKMWMKRKTWWSLKAVPDDKNNLQLN